ncbi:MAG TPA: arylsulfotransferase family protein [Solirubrobacteraceae bacterium]|jgi:hypothetical protein
MSEIQVPNAPSRTERRWRRASTAVVATFVAALSTTASLASTTVADAAPTQPPPVSILTSQGNLGRGDFFISPFGDATTYADGPEILDRKGNVVWFQAVPAGEEASDFRTQTYRGQAVLTWWQGTGLGGLASGTDYIYNDHHHQIATVQAGNGLSADGHEFLITPQNTALILSYTSATANLSSIGGPSNQAVIDGVVQEIDIATGHVLFQWNSADHVPYSQSEQPLPSSASTPWDWFHINAVKVDTDGNLLIDARDTWTTYKVNRFNGNIIWQLGGKASSFTLKAAPGQSLNDAGDIFAWQHDPEPRGNDEYTIFDNESAGVANSGVGSTSQFGLSRVVRFKLNERNHTATLLQSEDQPEGLTAPSQGNAQPLADGGELVGWGSLPYFSEFDSYGNLIFNAQLPAGVNSYRAYLLPWKGPGFGRSSGHGGHRRR